MSGREPVLRRLPRWSRVLLGEVLAIGAAVAAVLMSHPTQFSWAPYAALLACATLPLRLRWPWLAMVVCLPALAGGLGWPPAIVTLYRLGRQTRRADFVVAWVAVAWISVTLPLQFVLEAPWQDRAMSAAFGVMSVGAPAALGALLRARQELTASVVELRRAREAELAARIASARSAERARIAREIHDSVGHHATLIAVQAAALATTTEEPATREAAGRLRELARESVAEMRTTLGLGDVTGPPRGLAEIPDLIARARRAGLSIEFDSEPIAETCPQTGRAVYRVVQEGITNATKHAAGSSVRVRLSREPGRVFVSVVNDRPPGGGPPDGDHVEGTGLAGLAERVRNTGGTLRAEALPDGGFSVFAELPAVGQPPTKVGSAGSTFGGTPPLRGEP